MVDIKDIYWVAGLLEGEGCFSIRGRGHNPTIQLCMTDVDIVIRAAEIIGAHKVIQVKKDTRGGKQLYRTNLYGRKVAEWCMTLYSLMGNRRKIQIEACLNSWKERKSNYPERKPYSRGAIIAWEREGGVSSLTTQY